MTFNIEIMKFFTGSNAENPTKNVRNMLKYISINKCYMYVYVLFEYEYKSKKNYCIVRQQNSDQF